MRGFMALEAPPTCGTMSAPGSDQRVILRKRFGFGYIQRRANTSALKVGDEGVGVDEGSAPDVHDEGAVGQRREECIVRDVPGGLAPGRVRITISACGSSSGIPPPRARRCHPPHGRAKRRR